jgi:beta-lactamase class A
LDKHQHRRDIEIVNDDQRSSGVSSPIAYAFPCPSLWSRLFQSCITVFFCVLPWLAHAWPLAPQEEKASALRATLQRQLDGIVSQIDGVFGYCVVDLASGERFGQLEHAVFPTASTIKIAVLYELFKQAEEGVVRLDDVRPLDRKHVVAGTGVLRDLAAPAMPLRDYATLMIVLSDNTATNVIIDTLGMQKVTARMATLGLTETKLRRRMIDLAAARRGDENVSTPAELARLLETIHRGDGLTKESHQALLSILKKSKSSPLARGVTQGTEVAGKPGELEGVAVDAAIVYVEGRPYVFSAMSAFLKDDSAGDTAIEQASRFVFAYFNRVAGSSEFGRRIR